MAQQRIIPSVWCKGNAAEMVEFYTSAFGDVHTNVTTHYPTEGLLDFQKDLAGKILTIDFSVLGHRFLAINAGNEFQPNPSISFWVTFSAARHADPLAALRELWERLSEGGSVMMPLDRYDFSPLFGWLVDQFGVSWGLIFDESASSDPRHTSLPPLPAIRPVLMFSGAKMGLAEAAVERYTAIFPDSQVGELARYGEQAQSARPEHIMYADFSLSGQRFVAMDSNAPDEYPFSEAVSLLVEAETQEEIDRYWEALSRVPQAEVCGWCKDEFGVSWQVAPRDTGWLSSNPGAYAAMMGMKKIIIADLKAAANS